MAICGIKVRMGDSNTAMNGAKFQCCELPSLANTNASPSVVLPGNSGLVEDTATTDISISDTNSVINGKIKKFKYSILDKTLCNYMHMHMHIMQNIISM